MLRIYPCACIFGIDDLNGILEGFSAVCREEDAFVLVGKPEINNAAAPHCSSLPDEAHDGPDIRIASVKIQRVVLERPDLAAFENEDVFSPPDIDIQKTVVTKKMDLIELEAAIGLAIHDEPANDLPRPAPVQGDEPAVAVGAELDAEKFSGEGAILDPVDDEAIPSVTFLDIGRPVPAAGAEHQLSHLLVGTEATATDFQDRFTAFSDDLSLPFHSSAFDQEYLPAADDRADESVMGNGEPALPAEAVERAVRDTIDQQVQLPIFFRDFHPATPVIGVTRFFAHPVPGAEFFSQPMHVAFPILLLFYDDRPVMDIGFFSHHCILAFPP